MSTNSYEYMKRYYQRHPEKKKASRKHQNTYVKKRRRIDAHYKILLNIRTLRNRPWLCCNSWI